MRRSSSVEHQMYEVRHLGLENWLKRSGRYTNCVICPHVCTVWKPRDRIERWWLSHRHPGWYQMLRLCFPLPLNISPCKASLQWLRLMTCEYRIDTLDPTFQGTLSVANVVARFVVTVDRTAEWNLVYNEVAVATVAETISTAWRWRSESRKKVSWHRSWSKVDALMTPMDEAVGLSRWQCSSHDLFELSRSSTFFIFWIHYRVVPWSSCNLFPWYTLEANMPPSGVGISIHLIHVFHRMVIIISVVHSPWLKHRCAHVKFRLDHCKWILTHWTHFFLCSLQFELWSLLISLGVLSVESNL
jgi:hypothetical protein